MDLHGSEISRVGSRREISRVCLQDGRGRHNFVHLPTHKEFCSASGALRAHNTHTPFPERRTARLTRHSSAHASTSTARARSSASRCSRVRSPANSTSSSAAAALAASASASRALWGERSEQHRNFCTRILHVWAGFRAFDSPRKFRSVDTISRVGSPRGKISLTRYSSPMAHLLYAAPAPGPASPL